MANLRRLKKNIKHLCGDIASESIVAATFVNGADEKALANVVVKAAKLQSMAMKRVPLSFDKVPRDFDNKAAYRRAKRNYYKKAYDSLDGFFMKEAEEIVAELNKALPKSE